jgi:molybdate transport system ATP-binding protein
MSILVDVEKKVSAGFALAARFETSGRVTALFGRSGAGKSTLVNIIAGLLRPDRGRIEIDGQTLFDGEQRIDIPTRKRRVGYVFQEGRLFPHLSVRSNLLYGRRFTPARSRWGSLDEIVDLLGIETLLDRRPASLSGGEKQRVAIGRALLSSPRLLLMDEPLAALDQERKGEILPFIERLRDRMQMPIVYVSHAVDEVSRIADTVVLIEDGKVAAVGGVNEVLASRIEGLADASEAGVVVTAIRPASFPCPLPMPRSARPCGSASARETLPFPSASPAASRSAIASPPPWLASATPKRRASASISTSPALRSSPM